MSDSELVRLCDTAEVAPGCAKRAEAGGAAYAVYNLNGVFYVSQDECTHGPGYLSEGYILDDEIECPYHQGRFDEAGAAYARTGDNGFMPGLTYYNAACSYARVGQKERALELLAKAVQTGMIQDRSSMRRDPDLASIRDEPEYRVLLERLT